MADKIQSCMHVGLVGLDKRSSQKLFYHVIYNVQSKLTTWRYLCQRGDQWSLGSFLHRCARCTTLYPSLLVFFLLLVLVFLAALLLLIIPPPLFSPKSYQEFPLE